MTSTVFRDVLADETAIFGSPATTAFHRIDTFFLYGAVKQVE